MRSSQVLTPKEFARSRVKHLVNHQGRPIDRTVQAGEPAFVKPGVSDWGRAKHAAQAHSDLHFSPEAKKITGKRRIEVARDTQLSIGADDRMVFLEEPGLAFPAPSHKFANLDSIALGKNRSKVVNDLAKTTSKFTLSRIFDDMRARDPKIMEEAREKIDKIMSELYTRAVVMQRNHPFDKHALLGLDPHWSFADSLLDPQLSFKFARLIARSLMTGEGYYSLGHLEPEYLDSAVVIRELNNLMCFALELSETLEVDKNLPNMHVLEYKDRFLQDNVFPFLDFMQKVAAYLGPKQSRSLRANIYTLLDRIGTKELPGSRLLKRELLSGLVPSKMKHRNQRKKQRVVPKLDNMGIKITDVKAKAQEIDDHYKSSALWEIFHQNIGSSQDASKSPSSRGTSVTKRSRKLIPNI